MPGWMEGVTALSPDGARIALGGDALVVVSLEDREVLELARPFWGAWGVSWSPNGEYITSRIHARISLFDARTGRLLDQLSGRRRQGRVEPRFPESGHTGALRRDRDRVVDPERAARRGDADAAREAR